MIGRLVTVVYDCWEGFLKRLVIGRLVMVMSCLVTAMGDGWEAAAIRWLAVWERRLLGSNDDH